MPIKKGLLLVCGKTGRIVGLNRSHRWPRWMFPVVGLAALVWFLVRVIPSCPTQRIRASARPRP